MYFEMYVLEIYCKIYTLNYINTRFRIYCWI